MRTTPNPIWSLLFALGPLACSHAAPADKASSSGSAVPVSPPVVEDDDAGSLGAPGPVTQGGGPSTGVVDAGSSNALVDAGDGGGMADGSAATATASSDAGAAGDTDGDTAPSVITVDGVVRDVAGNPLAGQTVNVLDGAGASHAAITDATGAFAMSAVATPYALLVSGITSDPVQTAYLGLTTPAPQVLGSLLDTTAPSGSVDFTLSVAVPSCGTASCNVTVVGSSAAGVGFQGRAAPSAGSVAPFNGTFSGVGSSAVSATFNVLVSDSASSSYWFTQASVVLSPVGSSVAIGTLTPTSIPNAGTLTLLSTPAPSLSSWPAPSQSIDLTYPAGGGTVRLAAAASMLLSCAIPDVLGATLSVGTRLEDDADSGASSQVTVAEMNGLPLVATSEALTPQAPPTWTSPSIPGAAVSSTAALSWQEGMPNALTQVFLSNKSAGIVVFTDGGSISLDMLAKMGFLPAPGAYELVAEQIAPSPGLDAVLQAGALSQLMAGRLTAQAWAAAADIAVTLTP